MDLEIFKIAANDKNNNLLKNYDYILKQKNSMCGDEIEISIKLKNKKISKIGYTCKSCIYTQASASLLSSFLKNKSFDEIKELKLLLEKFFKKELTKLPRKQLVFSKLINKNNLARKECLMLPFITLNKMIEKL